MCLQTQTRYTNFSSTKFVLVVVVVVGLSLVVLNDVDDNDDNSLVDTCFVVFKLVRRRAARS